MDMLLAIADEKHILCWPSWKSLRQPWEKSVKSMACPQHKWERLGPYPKEFFPSLA